MGFVSVTVMGRATVAEYEAPPAVDTTCASRFSVDVPAAAFELPVSFSVHVTAPADVKLAALQVAVKPAGKPETTLMLGALLAVVLAEAKSATGSSFCAGVRIPLLPAIANPPIGVAVTVTVAVASDCTGTDPGEAASVIPAAGVTCTVTLLDAVNPSPAAVTVICAEPSVAVDAAVSVNVSAFELTLPAVASGFADQVAVTPAGKPLAVQLMDPLNEPPVAAVRLTVCLAPRTTLAELEFAVSVSIGACVTVSA